VSRHDARLAGRIIGTVRVNAPFGRTSTWRPWSGPEAVTFPYRGLRVASGVHGADHAASWCCISYRRTPSRFATHDSGMVYRKGELSPTMVDRDWPHQVALPAHLSLNRGHEMIREFCKDLSLCSRGHSVFHDDQWFNVYCFSDRADAEKFLQRFGGEKFDPTQRGRGSNWPRWKKS